MKWLLALPHYVVLAFLWLAFVALSGVAFFAIVLTGRYPRTIFEFNVGVLRWSWRVAYYAYGALGTDQYPPFSLREDQHYPANLQVDYPEHLSRGLVLVKWWLLAIPHYLIVAFFVGGGFYVASDATNSDQSPWVWGSGLIGLLALVAAVVLLFTGRYPQPIYDLVLGMNRWVLRVAAYAALMTDEYPPFRLDQGGRDPSSSSLTMTSSPDTRAGGRDEDGAVRTASPPTIDTPWTTGRVVSLVLGSVVLLASLVTGIAGMTVAVADTTMRDADGFLMSRQVTVAADTYAIASTNIEVVAGDVVAFMPQATLGEAKVVARATGDTPVFVGVAASRDVATYLAGTEHARVVDLTADPVYRVSAGLAPRTAPTQADIWVAQSAGTGEQSVVWPIGAGEWTVVVMNSDASRGLAADLAAGAALPILGWVVGALLSLAGMGVVLAAVLLVVPLRKARNSLRQPPPQPSASLVPGEER